MKPRFDDAVVGAGILGLAHAYHLARRGRKVVVFERGRQAAGASVRNFGMIWPIGQPHGPRRDLALRSREIWLDLLQRAGLWHDQSGSLHVARYDDEANVLQEFASQASASVFPCELLDAKESRSRCPALREQGLMAGLWSPNEVCVDPRQVIATLPRWLAETFDMRFEFGTAVLEFDQPRVRTSAGEVYADRLWVCSGDDFQTLFPEIFRDTGITRCKLQMMRTETIANGWRLGPMIAGGLTLRHYASFEACPGLAALKARIARETPQFDRFGIHVMASQNGRGEVVIGDSHEYDAAIDPFDKAVIDDLILRYLDALIEVPNLQIVAHWHGTYAKHDREPYLARVAAEGAMAVTCAGGAGMTLSFGLAEEVIAGALGIEQ
jgi:FAD dependent oxidoreductase TIGR03364